MTKKLLLLSYCVLNFLLINGQVSGLVFRDYNGNATRQNTAAFAEPLVSGLTVTATLSSGAVFTTTTNASGTYSFTAAQIPSGTAARIEFTSTAPNSFQGATNETNVQFVTAPSATASFAINDLDEFWDNSAQTTPISLIPVYANGATTNNNAALADYGVIQFNNASNGLTPAKVNIAPFSSIGAVYGIAYQQRQNRFFASSFLKRQSGLGPRNLSGVYIFNQGTTNFSQTGSFSLQGVIPSNSSTAIDLGSVTRVSTPNTADNYLSTGADVLGRDLDAFAKVGKVGFGDIEVDEANQKLFLINLNQRTLISIDIAAATNTLNNATASTLGPLTNVFNILTLPGAPTCTNGQLRPFALSFHNGRGYLGLVCDASNTPRDSTNLAGFILSFNPNNVAAGFTTELNINFNYRTSSSNGSTNRWHSWTDTWSNVIYAGLARYPEPMISDIDFDEKGGMIISIMDRFTHQVGIENYAPVSGSTTLINGRSSGDILYACKNGAGWIMEGTAASCTIANTVDNADGYGDGSAISRFEYFDDQSGDNSVGEFAQGSSAKLFGTNKVLSTIQDPCPAPNNTGEPYWFNGGIHWYDINTGSWNQYATFYDNTANQAGFGKANGLGDLEFATAPAKIQIGNRVWVDANRNGIQDPGEAIISGASVELIGPGLDGILGTTDDIVLATTSTNSTGNYYFTTLTTADSRKPAQWTGVGNNDILPNFPYMVRVNMAQTAIPANQYIVAPVNVNSNLSDNIDNDATTLSIGANKYAAVAFNTNKIDHSFDIGILLCSANAGPDISLSCTTPSVTIGTPAIAGSTYSWSPSTGLSSTTVAQPTVNALATTTYTVTVDGTCTDIVVVTVNKTTPAVTAASNVTITCTTPSATITANGAVSYVWNPATGLSNANIANPIATPATTTIYTVTGTAANGCTATSSVTVTVDKTNPAVTAASNVTITCTTPSATITANGAVSYVWNPATGLSNANIANPIANPATTTTYTVTGTAANGCTATSSVTVTVDKTNPAVTAASNVTITCTTPSATITANGAVSYVWNPATGLSNANIANPIANPATTTTYTVTGTAANGCTATSSVTVTVNKTNPSVTAASNVTITCTTPSATITANGAVTYVWNPATGLSNANIANPTATPAATTTYTVTGTAANGCTATSSVTVTVDKTTPAVTAASNVTITCTTPSATITANGAVTYVWNPATGLSNANIANPTATPATTTIYTVTGTAANGCTATSSVTVTVDKTNPSVTAASNVTITCTTPSATITANGAVSYVWSPATGLSNANIANPTATPATTTIYTVTGTAANGCTATSSVTVTVNKTNPSVTAASNVTITCTTPSATITANGAVTYVWNPATGLSNANIANPTATPATTTIYTVTGTAANGCTATSSVTVTVDKTTPAVTAASNVTITCTTPSATITANGAVSYVWNPATGLSNANIANPIATPATTTTYTVTGTAANGCTATSSVTVTVDKTNPSVTAASNVTITCTTPSATITANGAVTYVWNPATGLSNANIANPIATPATTTIYTVTGTAANGCSATSSVTVTVDKTNPAVTAASNVTITCTTPSATITANGAVTYVWNPATGLSNANIANPIATPATTTIYTVTGTAANGCTATSSVTVTVDKTNPSVTAASNVTITCITPSATIIANGAVTYVWNPATGLSNANIANPIATPATTTTYTVTGTTANGCTATSSVTVTVDKTNPSVTAASNVTITCTTPSATITANGAVTYVWSPATGLSNANIANPIATPATTTTYTVTGTAANGCTATSSVTVTVDKTNPAVTAASNVTITCTTPSATITANGAVTYVWSPATGLSNANIATPTATPATTAIYTVTGTAANGCTATSSVTVTVDKTTPAVTAASNVTITCTTPSATITANGAVTYVWNPATGLSNANIANPIATPATTTTYTVTGTAANGCTATSSVTVTVDKTNPSVTAASNVTITCTTPSATITANGAVTYVWNPATGLSNANIATPTATPAATTIYTVTGTAANGCTATSSVTVTVDKTNPIVSISGGSIVCNGSFTTLTASGASSYLWNVGSITTPSIIVGAGSYTVTGTGSNGCTSTSTAVVNNVEGSIGNYVWLDNNGNGLQDEGASLGINGITVELYSSPSNTLISSTTTANDGLGNPGYYKFPICLTGDYYVKFPISSGNQVLTNQTATVATNGNSDANVTTGNAPIITIDVNGVGTSKDNMTIDAGYYVPSSIGNYVWYDLNRNGLQDNRLDPNGNVLGAELPVMGVKAILKNFSGVSLDSVTTSATGFYTFNNLRPGDYYISFAKSSLPNDTFKATTPNLGFNDLLDSDVDTSIYQTSLTSLVSAENDSSWDMGIYRRPRPGIVDPCGCTTDYIYNPDGELYKYSELVSVSATPGGVWRVIDSNYSTGAKTFGILKDFPGADFFFIPGNPVGDAMIEVSPGQYTYSFYHDEGIGYSLVVTDGIDTLDISASCSTFPSMYDTTIKDLCYYSGAYVMEDTFAMGTVKYYLLQDSAFSFLPNFDESTLIAGKPQITQINPLDYAPGSTIALYMLWTPFSGLPGTNCPRAQFINITFNMDSEDCLSRLGDYVWRDDNKNGVQDGGEPGVSGVTVSLFDNTNKLVGSTITDATGKYLFADLIPGNYSVGFTLPANYIFTSSTGTSEANATNSDVNPTTGKTTSIELSAGEDQRNIDAGIIFNQPTSASVGDRVWLDINANGVQDANEQGVSDVLVELLDNSGATVAVALTDVNGNYLFTDVLPGNYSVKFNEPIGTVFTTSTGALTSATNSDANPATGSTGSFAVAAGDNIRYIDAGILPQATTKASLGDKVWNDLDVDGIQDAIEPGIPNVVVNLFAANGTTLLATTSTDAFGNYSFNNLDSGTYVVQFVQPLNFDHTMQNAVGSNASNNSDANTVTGKTATIVLKQGERNPTIDAGFIDLNPGGGLLLGDKVWYDMNNDGVQNATEQGVVGVSVTLYQNGLDGISGTSDDVFLSKTFTDRNGNYLFSNLDASTSVIDHYSVQFSNLPSEYSFTKSLQTLNGATMSTDSDPLESTGRTSSINLLANNLTIDAGIIKGISAGTASLGDKVFIDLNNNGIQEVSELGQSGVVVKLYNDANNDGLISGSETTPIKETTTDALGEYMFTGLPSGSYQVGFSNIPSGYSLSPMDAGTDDAKDSDGNPLNTSVNGHPATSGTSFSKLVNLAIGEDNLTIDLGIVPPANSNTLGDYVWFDANNDGLQSPNENGVAGVMVTLYNASGSALQSTVTDENGKYLFAGLADGSYSVGFSNLPAGFSLIAPSATNTTDGSDANPTTGKTVQVVLNAGNRNDNSLDAGLTTTRVGLGNYVWIDANRDGVQDASEQSVSGATATLYRPGFGLDGISGTIDDAEAVGTSITDANGKYYFGNLVAGTYQVGFSTIPSGYVFTKQNNIGDNQDNTNSDVNPTTGLSGNVALIAQEFDLTIDAGLVAGATATVGDYVWFDNNRNGLQEATEQPAAGVLATLFNSSNVAVGSAITDGTGKYLISNVPEGTGYYVKFNANITSFGATGRPTWTTANQGVNGTGTGSVSESNLDSDVSATAGLTFGNTGTFTVVNGDNIRNVDAGIYTPITLTGNVWHDINGNTDGFVNNSGGAVGASPIPVGLRAYLVNPTTNQIVKIAIVSSATGIYNMGEIAPSTNYYIILTRTSAAIGSIVPAASLPSGWENTGERLGITAGNDGVINGRLNIPGSVNNIINANFGIRLKNGEAVIP